MRRRWTWLAPLAVLAAPAWAQDPVKVAPEAYSVVAENDRLRVLRVVLPPKGKAPMHEHPEQMILLLTDTNLRMTMGDGTVRQAAGKAGGIEAAEAGKHQPENLGDQEFRALLVEVKPGPWPEPAATPSPSPVPKRTVTPVMSYGRAEGVRIKFEEGYEEPAGSTHAWDAVVIPTTAGMTLAMGGKTVKMRPGEPYLVPRDRPHQMKATSAAEVTVIRVK